MPSSTAAVVLRAGGGRNQAAGVPQSFSIAKLTLRRFPTIGSASRRRRLPQIAPRRCPRPCKAFRSDRTKMFHVKHFGKVHNIGKVPRLAGLYGSRRRQSYCSRPALGPCREADRLLGGAEQGLRLVDAFALFGRRIGIIDDPSAGLNIHRSILDDRGA